MYCINSENFLMIFLSQAMAADDTDLLQWFTDTSAGSCLSSSSTGDKENLAPPTVCVARQQGQSSSVVVMDESSQDSLPDDVSCSEGERERECVCV